jgi:hypothetical protein
MRTILLLAAAFFLLNCAPPPDTETATADTVVADSPTVEDDDQSCQAKGGTLRRICLMGTMSCVLKYADGGKSCTGKAQCLGQCRFEGAPPPPAASVVGVCQRTTDPCGCFAIVEGGRVQGMLCVD